MKRHSLSPRLAVFGLALLAVLALAGCPRPATVTVSPATATVEVGKTVQLTADSTEARDTDFTWSSDTPGVATVSTSGLVSGIAEGTAVITATGSYSGRTDSATVTVVPAWEPDTFVFDVEVAPDATMVEGDDLDLLVESDTENEIYTFDAAGAQASGLDLSVGRILIIHGVAVRRITTAETVGDDVVVETEFVPLNEVITDGTVSWDYGVEFTAEKIKSVELPDGSVIYTKDGTPIEFSLTVGEFTYEVSATLDTEVSNFNFTVTKGLAGTAEAKFIAEGQIERFRSRNDIEFGGGELQEFGNQLTGMRGDLTLELVVAASGQDFVNLEFPITIMKIPFVVGFIPVELNIRIQFVINASVPIDGSSRVKTAFTYDSDLGLSYNGTEVSSGGHLGSITFGEDVNETGASSNISANFGIGFPRVELSILRDSVVPWAQTAFLIGGSFTGSPIPLCQTADAEFLGAAGYKLGLFGLDLLSGSMTFFDEKTELLRAGDCSDKSRERDETALELLLVYPIDIE